MIDYILDFLISSYIGNLIFLSLGFYSFRTALKDEETYFTEYGGKVQGVIGGLGLMIIGLISMIYNIFDLW